METLLGLCSCANPPMIGPHFSLDAQGVSMKRSLTLLAVVIAVAAAGAGYWYVQGKQPQREGEVAIAGLQAPVTVRYDARGVPHLQAQNERTCTAPWATCMPRTACSRWRSCAAWPVANWPRCWATSCCPPTPCSAACASASRPR
jgi:hypothetical protein